MYATGTIFFINAISDISLRMFVILEKKFFLLLCPFDDSFVYSFPQLLIRLFTMEPSCNVSLFWAASHRIFNFSAPKSNISKLNFLHSRFFSLKCSYTCLSKEIINGSFSRFIYVFISLFAYCMF
jgi:hypothetical protein